MSEHLAFSTPPGAAPTWAGEASLRPEGGSGEWRPLPVVIGSHAELGPMRPALSFVNYSQDPEGSWQTLSFAQVELRVRALAAALEARFPAGGRVAVLCPPGLDYGLGFLACLYAGMTAVPLFPPDDPRRTGQLAAVLAAADPVCVLTTGREAAACQELAGGRLPVWVVEEAAERGVAGDWSQRWAAADEAAYLQYTSGSTGSPQGAVITHGNLVASTRQVIAGCGLDAATPIASWLPLFHDMGLSIGVLAPMMAGSHGALMSPLAFIQRPVRWLRLLTAHRAHFSGGPNFAYDLCVRKIPPSQLDGVDLAGVRVLTNGAEPVRAGTLRRFTTTFARVGLAADAVKPSYGLAEATVLVACNRVGQRWSELVLDADAVAVGQVRVLDEDTSPARRTTVVGCGRPVGQTVRVVDPDAGVELSGGHIGELWVRGPNVAAGYWRRPERSSQVFDRTLKNADGHQSGWLRTGDLGFLHQGEVFVLGRIKDVIVIQGTNHAASDIEDTVRQAMPEAVPGGVAAFAVPGEDHEGERLVVVVELAAGPHSVSSNDLRRRVRSAIAEGHGIRPHDVVAARRGSLARTTSGKLRRGQCKERYLAEQPTPAGFQRPGEAL